MEREGSRGGVGLKGLVIETTHKRLESSEPIPSLLFSSRSWLHSFTKELFGSVLRGLEELNNLSIAHRLSLALSLLHISIIW